MCTVSFICFTSGNKLLLCRGKSYLFLILKCLIADSCKKFYLHFFFYWISALGKALIWAQSVTLAPLQLVTKEKLKILSQIW